jgi:Zn-dependent protease with chaperone function
MTAAPVSNTVTPWIDRAIASNGAALICAVLLLTLPVLLLLFALPALVRWLPDQIPERWERPLGDYVLRSHPMFAKVSQLPLAQRQHLEHRVAALAQQAGLPLVRVMFFDAPAQALALPGNVIVLTDGMVNLLERDESIDAVVAHELGHLHHRHFLRQVIGKELAVALALRLNGQEGSSVQAGTIIADLALWPHFSREAEHQADAYAFTLLRARGQSPLLLGLALQQLETEQRARGLSARAHYTASHPQTIERLEQARRAAEE